VTRFHKVRTVAAFEFLTAVKRPGYLIATFGMPLFVAAYGAIVAIPAYYAEMKDEEQQIYGVVDPARVLDLKGDVAAPSMELPDEVKDAAAALGQNEAVAHALGKSNFIFRPFENEPTARQAMIAQAIKGYFAIAADYIDSGRVDIYTPDKLTMSGSDSRQAFANLLRERLVTGRIEDKLQQRVIRPMADSKRLSVKMTGEVIDDNQTASILRLAVPLVFIVLFLMSVLMTAGYLMQGTATEKENKVVEVLLASANPDEILAGKLVGLGGAGLLQIGVWLLMALATGIGVLPMLLASGVQIPWLAVGLALPLFIVSFVFFGSLILGTGSLGSNMREAQQLAMVWSLMAALPLMLLTVFMREPHGIAARVLTWVPFSSGSLIMLRASMDPAFLAWWEIVGALVVLALSTRLALAIGARLFRVGLLSSGARPKLREILRQARLAN
jgi:ABC-2 type transport system permease protein